MINERDADLLTALLQRGVIAPPELAEALAKGPRSEQTLEELLMERTRIARKDLESARQAPPPQASFMGKYRLLQPLGQGGMGEVFLALDTSLHRMVALKLLSSAGVRDLQRFKREAVLAAKLTHPNIVQVYEVAEAQGRHYLAMQYIPGESLGQRRVTAEEGLRVIRDAAFALEVAHDAGVLHRDIKPSNLLMSTDGHVYVSDFGIARELGGDVPTLSQTGDIVGTPGFMSPEQAQGNIKALGPWTDVYGLGATLYFLLTRELPFVSDDLSLLVSKIVTEDPPPPRKLNPSLSLQAESIILKAMAKEPHRRYATARALGEDLDRLLNGEAVLARPDSWTYRSWRRLRRYPSSFVLAMLTACVGALALYVFLRKPQESPQPPPATAPERARAMVRDAQQEIAQAREVLYRPATKFSTAFPTLDGAVARLREALKLDPSLADAYFCLGQAYDLAGEAPLASEAYSEVLRLDPANAAALAARTRIDLEEALMETEYEPIRTSPAWDRGVAGLAKLQELKDANRDTKLAHVMATILAEDYEQADRILAQYQREYRSDYEDFLKLRGDVWARQDNARNARACYDNALKRRPGYFQAVTARAMLNSSRGLRDEALREIHDILDGNPRYGYAAYVRARISGIPTDMDECKRLLPAFSPIYWFQATRLVAANDFDGALEAYTAALNHHDTPETRRRRGMLYLVQLQDFIHAFQDLEKAAAHPALADDVKEPLAECKKALGRE